MSARSFELKADGGLDTAEAGYGDDVIFWNVDTQYDFMRPDGNLPVGEGEGAEDIEPNLAELSDLARKYDIRVVNTGDCHNQDSEEFSDEPDFDETYSPHCLADSKGTEYVPATQPRNALELDWREEPDWKEVVNHQGDFVVYKDAFDVFAGSPQSPHAEGLVETLDPNKAVVYGVATDVCVDFAVEGLLDREVEVYVVEDAIKGISPENSEDAIEKWQDHGAKIGKLSEVENYLEQVK